MKAKLAILLVLIVSVFIVGCSGANSQYDGYASYNQPQGQGQPNSAVGGGCGVAPSSEYTDSSSGLDSAASFM